LPHLWGDLDIVRVRDHCPITEKYRGAAHNACNLKLRIYPSKAKVPVVFHNLRGDDGHLIMSALGISESTDDQNISCIPNNMEKYMTFGVGQLQFIDSLQFMNSSLDKLTANTSDRCSAQCGACGEVGEIKDGSIARDGNVAVTKGRRGKCKAEVRKQRPWCTLVERLKHTIANSEDETAHLLQRKGIYPYEHIDSFDRFDETSIPTKEAFYSRLTRDGISDADYQHAQTVWEEFKSKILGDYHDIYQRTSLLLAVVFETIRNTSCKIRISYYVSGHRGHRRC